MATIDQLQIEISASSRQASDSIDRLCNKLRGLGSALNVNLNGSLPDGLNELNVSLASLNTTIATTQTDRIKSLASALGSLSKVPNNTAALDATVTSLSELGNISISEQSVNGIVALSNAMGKLGGKASAGAAASIRPIAEGLRMLPEVVPAGENYIQLANGLAKLGGVKVQSAAGLTEVARGLEALRNVGTIPNMGGLVELGQALSVFGRQTAQNAVTVIPQLASAFRQLISTLSTAPTISRNVIDLANAMANLAGNTGRANTQTSRSIPLFNNMGRSANRAKSAFGGLAATIGKIYATYWLLFRAFSIVRKVIGFAADLTEVQNVVDVVFGDAKSKVEDFADSAIMAFGMSELSAKQFASKYQAMGSAMGITDAQVVKANDFLTKSLEGSKRKLDGVADSYKNLGKSTADMSINLTKLTADIGSFYNMDYDEVAEKMASVWTGQTRPMRQFGIDLTQATLQEWMLNNGIDGNIKKMTQAQKTMIRYQYVMSQLGHVMNDYARTADTWANVTRTIAEQFRKLGSLVGSGFINAFRPALVKFRDFMNTLIDLVEKGINAIGKLLGWQIEISEVGLTEDADAVEDIADGLGDAAGNAKKLNQQLMGFDKLNNITTPKDNGGSGSGSGATGGGGGSTNKATDPTVTWEKYESQIKNWFDLGSTISGKIADALENIDWKPIKKKAEDFGKNLASLMNGLFAGKNGERLFVQMGRNIAEAINTVMTAAKTWSDDLEWSIIGRNIRKGLISFLETWEPEITGRAVGGIVRGIAQAVYQVVSDRETWALLGSKIAEGINAFLDSMNERDEYSQLTGWEALGGSIASTLSGIGETIKTSLSEISWGEAFSGLWDGIKKFIDDLSPEGLAVLIGAVALPKLIKAALSSELAQKISVPVAVGIAGTLGAITFVNASDNDIVGKVLSGLTAMGSVFYIAKQVGGEKGKALGIRLAGVLGLTLTAIDFMQKDDGDLQTTLFDSISASLSGAMITKNPWGLLFGFPFYIKGILDWANSDSIGTDIGKWWEEIQKKWGNNKFLMVGLKLFNNTVSSLFVLSQKEWGKDKKLNVLLAMWGKSITELWQDVKKKWGDNKALSVLFSIGDGALGILWKSVEEGWGTKKTLKVLLGYFKNAVKALWESVQSKWGENKTLKTLMGLWSGTVATLWTSVQDKWGAKKTLKILLAMWGSALSNLWNEVKSKWGENRTLKVLLGLISGAIATLWTAVKEKWGLSKTLEVGLKLLSGALNNLWNDIKNFFSGKTIEVDSETNTQTTTTTTTTNNKKKKKALGGAFYNGRWHNIAQFAAGGRPSHGTEFIAGEKGAEVVGHIGGRSEVLNESQLASTMYNAVTDAMATQNAILIKQNQLLSDILAKDYGISSSDIFAATQREASSYTMRTGRPAFS